MKLQRLATLYFDPAPDNWRTWALRINRANVQTIRAWDIEGRLRLLIVAQVDLVDRLKLTDDGLVVVPEELRKQAEAAIEAAANLIAVSEGCKRSISSPTPHIAVLPESREDSEQLNSAKGILSNPQTIPGARFSINLVETMRDYVQDRLDGVALLAEALSHDHPTGKFHELMRLFERAFRRSSSKLVGPLALFLDGAHQGYTRDEVKSWAVKLRHPLTHADERADFLLQSDIRPVIQRMKQAAYDVLLNKAEWRNSSTERRKAWSPPAGTDSASGDLFLIQGREATFEIQELDNFGAYPKDYGVTIDELPEGWWFKSD